MTVEELINKLNQIEDKSKKVCIHSSWWSKDFFRNIEKVKETKDIIKIMMESR